MPTAAQPPPPKGTTTFTGMDDILVPTPIAPSKIKSETHPFRVLSNNANDVLESATRVYVTSENFDTPTSTISLAESWIARHSGLKSRFKLLSLNATASTLAKTVTDDSGKDFSPPYNLTFETQGAENFPGTTGDHSYSKRNRQTFFLLPVTSAQIFTTRVVRNVQYLDGFPQFDEQYKHFINTLKREVATQESKLSGNSAHTRRYYTAYFSFEIFLPAADEGNHWYINQSSQRTDVWHTKTGDVDVNMGVVSGYNFDPAQENKRIKENAKGLVSHLPGLVASMVGGNSKSKLTYIEVPFGSQLIYGHTDDDGYDTEVDLTSAYKKGKKFHLYIRAPSATVAPMLPDLYKWLAQFRVMEGG